MNQRYNRHAAKQRALSAIEELADTHPEEVAELEGQLRVARSQNQNLRQEVDRLKSSAKPDVIQDRIIEKMGRELQLAVNDARAAREALDKYSDDNRWRRGRDMEDTRTGMLRRNGYYVYQLIDESLSVIYVGLSTSLPGRLSSHSDKEWVHARYENCLTESQMREREAQLIHDLHPVHNKLCYVCGQLETARMELEANIPSTAQKRDLIRDESDYLSLPRHDACMTPPVRELGERLSVSRETVRRVRAEAGARWRRDRPWRMGDVSPVGNKPDTDTADTCNAGAKASQAKERD